MHVDDMRSLVAGGDLAIGPTARIVFPAMAMEPPRKTRRAVSTVRM
jgi:hypothetical protein